MACERSRAAFAARATTTLTMCPKRDDFLFYARTVRAPKCNFRHIDAKISRCKMFTNSSILQRANSKPSPRLISIFADIPKSIIYYVKWFR